MYQAEIKIYLSNPLTLWFAKLLESFVNFT